MAQALQETTITPDVIDEGLQPATAGILRELPRFRILLIGKAGVGKSSLVNKIFKVNDLVSVSHEHAGVSDINEELTWKTNPRFVLHDSQGFEAGEVENLEIVKTFVEERMRKPDLKDRLHAIWLCVAIPTSGGRVFERGDEEFLKFIERRVPIIAVFTKYDMLVFQTESNIMDDGATEEDIQEQVNRNFDQLCIRPLKLAMGASEAPPYLKVSVDEQHEKTIEELVETTQKHVSKFIGVLDHTQETKASQKKTRTTASPNPPTVLETPMNSSAMESSRLNAAPTVATTAQEESRDVSLVWAMAQRASPDVKVSASIEVVKKYWKGISTTSIFEGKTLEECIHTIHCDIVTVWNFSDPEKLLESVEFKSMIAHLVTDLADPPTPFNLPTQLGRISGAATILSGTIPPIALVDVPLGALLYWTTNTWHDNCGPGALRALMGYMVDLTIVMQHIFYQIPGTEHVSRAVVEQAFREYSTSTTKISVHSTIWADFDQVNEVTNITGNNGVLEEMKRLIDLSRLDPQRSDT